jgi:AcrR family transcriptional regulator
MADIAAAANTTVANLYVYFPSKIVLLDAVYRPWLRAQLTGLAASVTRFRSPQARLKRIFLGIWADIPAADHCFANCLMEALAAAPETAGKPSDLLIWAEETLSQLLAGSLPRQRQSLLQDRLLAHTIWMAFDGFAINRRIGDIRDIERIAELHAALLLGETAPARRRRSIDRPRRETENAIR